MRSMVEGIVNTKLAYFIPSTTSPVTLCVPLVRSPSPFRGGILRCVTTATTLVLRLRHPLRPPYSR